VENNINCAEFLLHSLIQTKLVEGLAYKMNKDPVLAQKGATIVKLDKSLLQEGMSLEICLGFPDHVALPAKVEQAQQAVKFYIA